MHIDHYFSEEFFFFFPLKKIKVARWRNLWMALKEQIQFRFAESTFRASKLYNLFWSLCVSDQNGICNLNGCKLKDLWY